MTEVLPDRDEGDDGGLREDFADVDRLQKIRGRLTDHCDEQDQAQERADGEKAKGEPDRERPAGATREPSFEGHCGAIASREPVTRLLAISTMP